MKAVYYGKKKYNLKKNSDFSYVIQKGKIEKSKFFLIYYLHRNDFKTIRVGISVPKKHFNRAFLRNKIKRQVRSMIQDILKQWSVDIVIIIKKDYTVSEYQQNQVEIKKLLAKIPLKGEF